MWVRNVLVYICFAWLVVGGTTDLAANNISVSNVRLTGKNTTSNYVMVEFDLSWENSWRTTNAPNNWDAAWVFIKFRVARDYISDATTSSTGTTVTVGSTTGLRVGMPIYKYSGTGAVSGYGTTVVTQVNSATTFTLSAAPSTAFASARIVGRRIWEHAYLHNSGHIASDGTGTGAKVQVGLVNEDAGYNATTNPAVGAFFYRSGNGTGTTTINNAQLRWNYGDNNVGDNDPIEVEVFAIEMVYVPQGAFYLGSGGTEQFSFTDGVSGPTGASTRFLINSEAAVLMNNAAGNLWAKGSIGVTANTNIPAAFPKGYDGFYCMKHEFSIAMYREFLNSLTYGQQGGRATLLGGTAGTAITPPGATNARGRLEIVEAGSSTTFQPVVYGCDFTDNGVYNQSNDGEWIACTRLTMYDCEGLADWTGLRSMTELEFEKACRGPLDPVADEYAWGTDAKTNTNQTYISNGGTASEADGWGGNVLYTGTGNTGAQRVGSFAGGADNRVNAGASYYGILDLSGNVVEGCITVGGATGRGYTGLHGNGMLTSAGAADVTNWMGTDANEFGGRGGGYNSAVQLIMVSNRSRSVGNGAYGTSNVGNGYRAVRSLPTVAAE